jgi:hypothetical protein
MVYNVNMENKNMKTKTETKTKVNKVALVSWTIGLAFTGVFWAGVYFIALAIKEAIK